MQSSSREKPKKRHFTKEVRVLMYGFGDVPNPSQDSVELMEDMLTMYLSDMCKQVRKHSTTAKPKTADFLHVLRHDPKKLARAHELLALDRDLKKAREVFNDIPEVSRKT
ncbi:transcription initiation factor-like protein TFIID subunit 13 [Gaertneriomyces semiglobifer]|nr:transcription initiation factor-like protein TFIID subunit 13 [Gaertneriomyces semiglobifer]